METALHIDVATLDVHHRRMLEEVIGRTLATNQRLIIRVTEMPAVDPRPTQTWDDWTRV